MESNPPVQYRRFELLNHISPPFSSLQEGQFSVPKSTSRRTRPSLPTGIAAAPTALCLCPTPPHDFDSRNPSLKNQPATMLHQHVSDKRQSHTITPKFTFYKLLAHLSYINTNNFCLTTLIQKFDGQVVWLLAWFLHSHGQILILVLTRHPGWCKQIKKLDFFSSMH